MEETGRGMAQRGFKLSTFAWRLMPGDVFDGFQLLWYWRSFMLIPILPPILLVTFRRLEDRYFSISFSIFDHILATYLGLIRFLRPASASAQLRLDLLSLRIFALILEREDFVCFSFLYCFRCF